MKTLKNMTSILLIASAFSLQAADTSAGTGSRPGPDLQGGFTCQHASPEGVETYYLSIGYMESQSFCVAEHDRQVSLGTLRHDKGGNPEDCVISIEPLN